MTQQIEIARAHVRHSSLSLYIIEIIRRSNKHAANFKWSRFVALLTNAKQDFRSESIALHECELTSLRTLFTSRRLVNMKTNLNKKAATDNRDTHNTTCSAESG